MISTITESAEAKEFRSFLHPTPIAPPSTTMMSNELAGIFTCFIFGLIFTFASWRAWTRKQVHYRSQLYRCEDSPFAFWLILSFQILCAVLSLLLGIVLSIHLLRSSWRTVNSGGEGSSQSLTLSQRPSFPHILNRAPSRGDQDDPVRRWSCLQRQPRCDLKPMAILG